MGKFLFIRIIKCIFSELRWDSVVNEKGVVKWKPWFSTPEFHLKKTALGIKTWNFSIKFSSKVLNLILSSFFKAFNKNLKIQHSFHETICPQNL